jgi:hypothetical protein
VQEPLHPRVGEAQPGHPLPVDHDGVDDRGERPLTGGQAVADPLDVEQTSVGLEADLPQRGQVLQPLADPKVAGCR